MPGILPRVLPKFFYMNRTAQVTAKPKRRPGILATCLSMSLCFLGLAGALPAFAQNQPQNQDERREAMDEGYVVISYEQLESLAEELQSIRRQRSLRSDYAQSALTEKDMSRRELDLMRREIDLLMMRQDWMERNSMNQVPQDRAAMEHMHRQNRDELAARQKALQEQNSRTREWQAENPEYFDRNRDQAFQPSAQREQTYFYTPPLTERYYTDERYQRERELRNRDQSRANAEIRELERELRRAERDLDRERSEALRRELSDARARQRIDKQTGDDLIAVPENMTAPAPRTPSAQPNYPAAEYEENRRLRTEIERLRQELANSSPSRDTLIMSREVIAAPLVIRDTVTRTETKLKTVERKGTEMPSVLFAHDSSELDEQAKTNIRETLAAFQRDPEAEILLRGFASPLGSVPYNQALSRRRAEAVKTQLVQHGIPGDAIRIVANGEDGGPSRDKARRVEITLMSKTQ